MQEKGSILAGIIQIFACLIVYKFNIPNPNIVLFVVLSASIVQSGYLAGIISGVIAVLYSAFFFSTDHSWIFYTPINRDKLCVIVLGVISNDAILMDIMMPVMDGLTATKAIRALNRPDAGIIPIIAMTANAFAEDVQRCLDAGMNAHLAKPLDIEKVKKTICEHTIEIRLPQSHWL